MSSKVTFIFLFRFYRRNWLEKVDFIYVFLSALDNIVIRLHCVVNELMNHKIYHSDNSYKTTDQMESLCKSSKWLMSSPILDTHLRTFTAKDRELSGEGL